MKKIKLFAAALAIACAGSAHALTMTYTQSYATASTNWNHTFAVTQFNTSGGKILDSITFSTNANVTGSVSITNNDSSTDNLLGYVQADVYLGLTNYGTNARNWANGSSLLDAYAYIDTTGNTAFDNVTPGSTVSSGTLNTTGSALTVNSGSLFSLFQGTGTVNLYSAAIGSSGGSGGGNLTVSTATAANAAVQVIYTYHTTSSSNAVPEPATLALTGMALLAFAASRRKA